MTDSAETFNTAAGGSTVGIQAGSVEDTTVYVNSTIYTLADDATPETKFRTGVTFLDAGMPAKALKLISDAIAHGHDSGRVRFHWVLAMLSKRSLRDLTSPERDQLALVSERLHGYADDAWKRALKAVLDLLNSLSSPTDISLAQLELDDIPSALRAMIDRHLDLVLTGWLKNGLWARIHERTSGDRLGNERDQRVWTYFQPLPVEARVRNPEPISTSVREKAAASAWTVVFVAGAVGLGWKAVVSARPVPVALYVLALAFGVVAARDGRLWHYQKQRLTGMTLAFLDPGTSGSAPEGGFAATVTHDVRFYFAKNVPKDIERDDWLEYTAGMRNSLRDELVEIYREKRTNAGQIRWLIRFHARQTKARWEAGGDWTGRSRFRTAWALKARCVLALSLSLAALAGAVVTLVSASIVAVASAALLVTVSVRPTARRLARISSERWRWRDQQREQSRLLAQRMSEFERWKEKLDQLRPSESEMEYWLYCDKTILLGNALTHYRLGWKDVIAHAFLQAPGEGNKRARRMPGPWRYSRYEIRLFLVTLDGVREVYGRLDFENADIRAELRTNFRFDAVSSVSVAEPGTFSQLMELSLTNGPARKVRITEPVQSEPDTGEDPAEFSEINQDASGFHHALHILEGIAAEGKEWIARDPEARSRLEGQARRVSEADSADHPSDDEEGGSESSGSAVTVPEQLVDPVGVGGT
jgi:hypothetical protein